MRVGETGEKLYHAERFMLREPGNPNRGVVHIHAGDGSDFRQLTNNQPDAEKTMSRDKITIWWVS